YASTVEYRPVRTLLADPKRKPGTRPIFFQLFVALLLCLNTMPETWGQTERFPKNPGTDVTFSDFLAAYTIGWKKIVRFPVHTYAGTAMPTKKVPFIRITYVPFGLYYG